MRFRFFFILSFILKPKKKKQIWNCHLFYCKKIMFLDSYCVLKRSIESPLNALKKIWFGLRFAKLIIFFPKIFLTVFCERSWYTAKKCFRKSLISTECDLFAQKLNLCLKEAQKMEVVELRGYRAFKQLFHKICETINVHP